MGTLYRLSETQIRSASENDRRGPRHTFTFLSRTCNKIAVSVSSNECSITPELLFSYVDSVLNDDLNKVGTPHFLILSNFNSRYEGYLPLSSSNSTLILNSLLRDGRAQSCAGLSCGPRYQRLVAQAPWHRCAQYTANFMCVKSVEINS
jgi:hypothetical protein